MILHFFQVCARTRAVDEIDRQARLAEPARSTDSMQISFKVGPTIDVHRDVKIDDDRHLLDVDAARADVRRDEQRLFAIAKTTEDRRTIFEGQLAGEKSDGVPVLFHSLAQGGGRLSSLELKKNKKN